MPSEQPEIATPAKQPVITEELLGRVHYSLDKILDLCRDQGGWRLHAIAKEAKTIEDELLGKATGGDF